MLDVYKSFYKLTDIPFRLSPDHRFSFGHHSYVEAKAYLEYAIYQGEGFITVTGRPGTGKTTLISEILSEIDKSHVLVAMVNSTQLDARDLLHMVATSFGIQLREINKVTLLLALERFLIRQCQKGLRSVLIVDEAQGLSLPALEELRLLANLQHENRLLLQVCLVGQERLRTLISAPDMEHFQQRLIAAAHLDTLNLDETITYIEHRLCCAGWRGDPAITEKSLRRIYQSSGGIPRKINLICNRMFLYGGLEGKHELNEEDAQLMINELQEEMLLTADGATESSGADASGDETVKVVRSLPRGEMLTRNKPSNPSGSTLQPREHAGVVKAKVPDEVPVPTPSETAVRVEPVKTSVEHSSAQRPPASARAVTGEPSSPPPEETPAKPANSRFSIMMQAFIALLLAAFLAFMAVTNLPQYGYSLLKQGSDNQDISHIEATPEVNQPQAVALPKTQDAQKFPDNKPEVAQSSGKLQPNRDVRRHNNSASAIPTPKTDSPEETRKAAPQTRKDNKPEVAQSSDKLQPNRDTRRKNNDAAAIPISKKDSPAETRKPAPQAPRNNKPVVAQPIGRPQPKRDARRQNNSASAIATPKTDSPEYAKKPVPQVLPAGATLKITKQPAVAKQIALAAAPKTTVAKKAADTDTLQGTVVINFAPTETSRADVEKQVATLDAAQTAVIKRVDPAIKSRTPSEDKRLPSQDRPGQQLERLIKSPGQSQPEAAKPVTPVALKNNVAVASAIPPKPSARLTKSAFTPNEMMTYLLAGRWSHEGEPTSILPSELTLCRTDRQTINCWSDPLSFHSRDVEVATKTEANLKNFSDKSEFYILYKTFVKPVAADEANEKTWQVTVREMICVMKNPDSVLCQDQNGGTNEYRRSGLSR